jgi:drug/metabolite transporter (DMT)-like permease
MRTTLLTALALVAFAANSLLCRLALGSAAIDAGSFTALRLAAGAVLLCAVVAATEGARAAGRAGSWRSGLALFLYAAPFSFAYRSLSAGTGALVLFGAVQVTMIAAGLRGGDRPHRLEWVGLAVAIVGLVALVMPGLRAPAPLGCLLMALAGVAWGVYSLRGRAVPRPVAVTAGNFLRAVPFAVAVGALFLRTAHVTPHGATLAVVSGAVTSGLGYVVWYAALRGLSATRAATVQLAVPALAALGGVLVLDERLTGRLLTSAALILGGVAIALRARLHSPTQEQR